MPQSPSNLIISCIIPSRCTALKNNKNIFERGGKIIVVPSARYQEWLQSALEWLMVAKGSSPYGFPHEGLVRVKALFYFDRNEPDLDNMLTSVAEALQKGGVLIDDQQIASYDGSRKSHVSRGNSKTIIEVYQFEENLDGRREEARSERAKIPGGRGATERRPQSSWDYEFK